MKGMSLSCWSVDRFLRERARWSRLLAAASREEAVPWTFLSHDWLSTWFATLGSTCRSGIFILERQGVLQAALPLTIASECPAGRSLRVAGRPQLDSFEIPAVSPGARASLLVALPEALHRWAPSWRRLQLDGLAWSGPTLAVIHARRELAPWRRRAEETAAAPSVDLSTFGDAGGFRSRNLRSQLRRTGRRLGQAGRTEIEFRRVEAAEVEGLHASCAAVEAVSWKGAAGQGLMNGSAAAFSLRIWQGFATAGDLLLGTLRHDGRLIAYHWGFRDGTRFLSYNLAYRPEHRAFGPGTLLLDGMIRLAPGLGLERLDAGHGDAHRPHQLARYHGPGRRQGRVVLHRHALVGLVAALIRARRSTAGA
jgi:CelD/BcsL family acetyltransferase involved in cellulose biosynthesis